MNLLGTQKLPKWLPYFDVACAGLAGVLWLIQPQLGFWPLLVGLAPWAIRFLMSGRLSVSTAYDVPLVIFILTALVGIWSAYNSESAWAKFWLIIGAVLIFYAYANWAVYGGRSGGYEQAWTLAVLGGMTAVYFLVSHDWDVHPAKLAFLTPVGRLVQAPLTNLSLETIHPNIVGGVLAMMAPFSGAVVWLSWKEKKTVALPLAIALMALILFALLLTTARGAWLGLAVATALVTWWAISRYLARDRQQRRWWFLGLPVVFLIFLLFIAVAWPEGLEQMIGRLPVSESGMQRGELYANSLALMSDYPIIGAGLGGYMMLYSTYALLIHVGFNTSSHNMYFDVIIDQGLVALTALFWMWLLMGESVWRTLGLKRSRRSRRRRTVEQDSTSSGLNDDNNGRESGLGYVRTSTYRVILGAAAMSLMVLLVHGLVDDSIYYTRAMLIFFLPLAFSVPILKRGAAWSRRQKLYTISAAALIVIVIGVIWWRPVLSMFQANLAAVQQSKSELSVYEWPDWPIQDEVRREGDLSTSIAGFERALEVNPRNASANRRLGQIELSMGEYEDALAHLEMAYLLTPQDNATRQLLGEALIANGRLEEGAALWRTVNSAQQQFSIRQFWYGYIGDSERQDSFSRVVQAMVNNDG